MNYDALFSSVGQGLQQSAIRQMGTVAAQNPNLISLAPGYPDPGTFAWDAYLEITEALLNIVYPHYVRTIPSMSVVEVVVEEMVEVEVVEEVENQHLTILFQ